MSNFVPNETKRFLPRDPPWITRPLKTCLTGKIGFIKVIKDMVTKKRTKFGIRMSSVEDAKLSYLTTLGNKANDPSTFILGNY